MVVQQLIGHKVTLAYRDGYTSIVGTLRECDGLFVVIDQGEDTPDVFIPLTSILHLRPIRKTPSDGTPK